MAFITAKIIATLNRRVVRERKDEMKHATPMKAAKICSGIVVHVSVYLEKK